MLVTIDGKEETAGMKKALEYLLAPPGLRYEVLHGHPMGVGPNATCEICIEQFTS